MKYLRRINESNIEELFSPIIDMNIIYDMKDMALEYLDNNKVMRLNILYPIGTIPTINIFIYSVAFSHEKCIEGWNKSTDINQIIDESKLLYNLVISDDGSYYREDKQSTKELRERLKDVYPYLKIHGV